MADDEIWIIFDDISTSEACAEKVRNLAEKEKTGNKYLSHIECTFISSSKMAADERELIRLLCYARRKSSELNIKDFWRITEDFVSQMRHEKEMERKIDEAMQEDRIEVFYQPIFSTQENRFVSAEALVRMRSCDGELVPPGEFIPIAEKTGKILELGRIVFEKVCKFFVEEHLEQYGIEYIEVNLSVLQCGFEGLADDYISIMEKYRINPGFINLEITESASLSGRQILLQNMKKLMDYGVHFSLDDFGTGQSNLNYIIDMPVNIVKFDREMTQAFFHDEKAKYVMNAAIQMIQGMKLKIVSEGIEEKEQYKIMKDMKIDYIQGYYFSKPLSDKDFVYFLLKEQVED